MSYTRVIPRDFFNESKLLKCLGQLSLKIHDCKLPKGIEIEIEETDKPFIIELEENLGLLYVSNYEICVNNYIIFFGTTYNSKDNYPLIAYTEYEEFRVFDEKGDFTDEFINKFKTSSKTC